MTKKQLSQTHQLSASASIAVCSFALDSNGDGAMQLFPAGTFDAPRGALRGQGPWHLDADSAQRLISTVAQRKNGIVVDYEHQSLRTEQNGLPVIAAGWIGPQTLEWREPPAAYPGLFAVNPEWTAAASGHIAADEIRYVSPVFSYDAKTGVVLDIINVALTNSPAIDGMQAVTLAAASMLAITHLLNPTESAMDEELRERLLWLFNLPTLASDADILAEMDKAKALISSPDAAATSLLDVLSSKNAEIAALSARSVSAEVDPTQYAPIAVVTELRGQLAALSSGAVEDRVEKLIEQGVADGRIIGEPAKAWLTDMGKKDLAALSSYLEAAQPIAALSGMQTQGKSPTADNNAGLTADELAVCSALNVDVNEFKKTKAA
ncbi:MAG: phage protease [Methylobacter sp.]|uniref:Phage protease n=1 Tax=Candidatus Methylobacter titanis TaxID=3053457 RepID=A0AA43TPZ9_9GAMM|nr:phage protease [Candidatus Methylobacter titanis]